MVWQSRSLPSRKTGWPRSKNGTQLFGPGLGGDLAGPPLRTLEDWVVTRLGRPVRGGDVLRQGDVSVIVRSVRRQHVHEAQVSRDDRGH